MSKHIRKNLSTASAVSVLLFFVLIAGSLIVRSPELRTHLANAVGYSGDGSWTATGVMDGEAYDSTWTATPSGYDVSGTVGGKNFAYTVSGSYPAVTGGGVGTSDIQVVETNGANQGAGIYSSAKAECPSGYKVVGGGCRMSTCCDTIVRENNKTDGEESWSCVSEHNYSGQSHRAIATAICVDEIAAGSQGPAGPAGADGKQISVIATHSQTDQVPNCPSGWNSLWTGYSLMGLPQDEGPGALVDLGGPGSCIEDPGNLIITDVCDENNCSGGNPESVWLSIEGPDGDTSSSSTSLSKTSRCNVCEKPATVLTRHDATSCPAGWNELWSGYGLVSVTTTRGNANHLAQDLSGPGSCLKVYERVPFRHCKDDSGIECSEDNNDYESMWLEGAPAGNCVVCEK